MELASREYLETKESAEIAHDIDWLAGMALNPPQWLRMTDSHTGELHPLFLNMLEALNAIKHCGCGPVQIEAYLLRHTGLSLRKTGRILHISHTTVQEHCRAVNLYARDYLASISD